MTAEKYEALSPIYKDMALSLVNKYEALLPINRDKELSSVDKYEALSPLNKDKVSLPINKVARVNHESTSYGHLSTTILLKRT